MRNGRNPVLHVGCVETQIQYTVLLEDKNDAVAITVNIDAGICNNGLVDELWNCEISDFLRVREVFGVLCRYTVYANSCLPTFRGSLSFPSSTLIIPGLLDSV